MIFFNQENDKHVSRKKITYLNLCSTCTKTQLQTHPTNDKKNCKIFNDIKSDTLLITIKSRKLFYYYKNLEDCFTIMSKT